MELLVSSIVPTVTAFTMQEYRQQLEQIQGFAQRIHIDFMDGVFAPTVSVGINDVWWQPGPMVDLHVMYQNPLDHLEDLVALHPDMIIVHAEAHQCLEFLRELDGLGIKKGLALLKDTTVESVLELIPMLDHVLIFSGDLGHFGGTAELSLLSKVTALRALKPSLEIGWDGGINRTNARDLADGGVDVLNVGGAIQKAENPEMAYDTLVATLKSEG
jgi:ribulose-phosphate 3-epimerase